MKKSSVHQNAQGVAASNPQNANGTGNDTQQPSPKQPAARKSARVKPISRPAANKSMGPRTAAGKERSKFNAVKHGLFMKTLLLEGESRSSYNALLEGLWEEWKPQGTSMCLLVVKLAGLWWRWGRLIRAESAEIRNKEFMVMDALAARMVQQLDCVRPDGASVVEPGGSSHTAAVWAAINCLKKMRIALHDDADGLKAAGKLRIRKLMFGHEEERPGDDRVLREFLKLLLLISPSKAATADDGPDQLKERMEEGIGKEIARLMKFLTLLERTQILKAQANASFVPIPPQGVADQLIRYEAHLSREIDRTIDQLERMEQRRKG